MEAVQEPARMAELLRGIRSKYGVYACYGNHDIEEPILAGFTFRAACAESEQSADGMRVRPMRAFSCCVMRVY